jgi:hypothetical protein
MAKPCPHCGAEKTESVPHGFLYAIAKVFGYRLRACSRCRRLRLLPRQGERREASEVDVVASEPRAADASPRSGRTNDADSQPPAADACPHCGSKDYRRSRRLWWERLIGRGPMARCRACRYRFPHPLLSDEVSE